MGRKSRDSYSDALGLREVETALADTFEAEFPIVTGRTVRILSIGEAPDRVASIDGINAISPLCQRRSKSLHRAPDSATRRLSACTGFSKPDLKSCHSFAATYCLRPFPQT